MCPWPVAEASSGDGERLSSKPLKALSTGPSFMVPMRGDTGRAALGAAEYGVELLPTPAADEAFWLSFGDVVALSGDYFAGGAHFSWFPLAGISSIGAEHMGFFPWLLDRMWHLVARESQCLLADDLGESRVEFIAHPSNPVKSLTFEQVRQLFEGKVDP